MAVGLVHPAGPLDGLYRDLFHGSGLDRFGRRLFSGLLETDRPLLLRPAQGECCDATRQEERSASELSNSRDSGYGTITAGLVNLWRMVCSAWFARSSAYVATTGLRPIS